ncbi:MAG TPA: hypothetical protein VN958_00230 [Chitinophagaceae bacterium]|nr:hypothetical protein [Chitinophagaceae bacterium]
MNKTFDQCGKLLQDLSAYLHMTYKEINIWIFVIIEPVVFLCLLLVILRQYRLIWILKKNNSIMKKS